MDVQNDIARKVLVCVVDGNAKHRGDIVSALMSFYQVRGFADGGEAMAALAAAPPAAIIVDEDAPSTGGTRIVEKILLHPKLKDVALICTSVHSHSQFFDDAARLGVRGFLTKPFRRHTLIDAISRQVNHHVESAWEKVEPVQRTALKQTVTLFNSISDKIDHGEPLLYTDAKESCAPLVEAISSNHFKDILRGVRGHDNYSYVHSLRVATFLSLFGHTIGIRGDDLAMLATGGLIHDVGKMSIPHEVLNKPGRLEGEEWAVMKSHVERTVNHLRLDPLLPKGVLIIAAQHHEKLDGSGYPKGLSGSDLNELARMASIVDIFGALTDRRVYKDPMPPEKALEIMSEMTNELDQHLLALFRTMLLDAASGLDET